MHYIRYYNEILRIILALHAIIAAATVQPSVVAAQVCPHPAIDEKYAQLDEGLRQLFGRETENGAARDGGCYRHYENGSIYWSPESGAQEVHGDIRAKWASLGWEWGLGYPLTDETPTPDGFGRYNHFQGGSIYWTPDTGAHEVHGAIRDKWESLGWELSFLRYPLTDETATPDGIGRFNHFQRGSIYWHPETGAHEVHGAIRDKWEELGWELSFLGYPLTDELVRLDGTGRYNHFQGGSIHWNPAMGAHVFAAHHVVNGAAHACANFVLKATGLLGWLGVSADPPDPGWVLVQRSDASELLGRDVRLPKFRSVTGVVIPTGNGVSFEDYPEVHDSHDFTLDVRLDWCQWQPVSAPRPARGWENLCRAGSWRARAALQWPNRNSRGSPVGTAP